MNMKPNYSMKTGPGYPRQVELASEKQQLKQDARMIMFGFLSEIERLSDQKRGFKKRLAGLINKSSSFITQLFNGNKLVSLMTIAQFQKALGIRFTINAQRVDELNNSQPTNTERVLTANIFLNHPVSGSYPNIDFDKDAGMLMSNETTSSKFIQLITKSESNLS